MFPTVPNTLAKSEASVSTLSNALNKPQAMFATVPNTFTKSPALFSTISNALEKSIETESSLRVFNETILTETMSAGENATDSVVAETVSDSSITSFARAETNLDVNVQESDSGKFYIENFNKLYEELYYDVITEESDQGVSSSNDQDKSADELVEKFTEKNNINEEQIYAVSLDAAYNDNNRVVQNDYSSRTHVDLLDDFFDGPSMIPVGRSDTDLLNISL